ncbi:MAG: hydrogenase assembly protein HypC, partial [Candidatus Latescibacterota bacterium]
EVCTVMVPEVQPGDWVLVHAGYAITRLDPAEAAETFEIIARTQQRSSEREEATDA